MPQSKIHIIVDLWDKIIKTYMPPMFVASLLKLILGIKCFWE